MYQIEGYDFEDKDLAEKAEIEAEGIRYIKEHTKFDDPMHVLKLYRQMINEQMFETPVGITFLKELQVYLLSLPNIDQSMVMDIPVSLPLHKEQKVKEVEKKEARESGETKQSGKELSYKKRYEILRVVALILLLSIIGMFVITAVSSNNVTILNYENALINKYEEWELELQDREAKLNEREASMSK